MTQRMIYNNFVISDKNYRHGALKAAEFLGCDLFELDEKKVEI